MSFQFGTAAGTEQPTLMKNLRNRIGVEDGDLTYGSVRVYPVSKSSSPPVKSLTAMTAASAQPIVRPTGPKPGANVTRTSSSLLSIASPYSFQTPSNPLAASPTSSPDQAVSPLVSFDALKGLQNKPTYPNVYVPPDTEGDVGPNNYIQSVNTIFAIYSKAGALLAGPFGETQLFASNPYCGQSADNGGDPIVKYDALADRWLFTYLSYPVGFSPGTAKFYLCTAVSQSGDPTGAWWLYVWRYDNIFSTQEFPDYPKYSVWPDGFYMTVNQFNLTNLNDASHTCNPGLDGCYDGVGVAVFNRTQMESGADAQAEFVMVPPGQGSSYGCDFSFLPSDLNGVAPSPGTPNTFAELIFGSLSNLSSCYGFEGLKLWTGTVNWATDSFTVTTNSGMNLPTLPYNPDLFTFWGVPQPAPAKQSYVCPTPLVGTCTDFLDPLSDRLMYRLQYRNFGSYQSILATHAVDENGNNHAGVRWYELRNTGSGWSIYQQGDYAPDSNNRWMASIAQDSVGDIAACYSVSSLTVFPSIRCTARLIGDPLGQMTQPEMTVVVGTGSQLDSYNGPGYSGRWGDYSALQLDPSDDTTFWYTNEYYKSSGTYLAVGWSTRIASFTLRALVTIGLDLVAGWNLISLPLVPANPQITSILAPLISSKNVVIVWTYSGTPKPSWTFFTPPSNGLLKTMVDGNGYWIQVNFATTLQVTGYIVAPASAPPSYTLVAGWNLLGFKPQPTIQSETVGQYLTSIGTACSGNPCYNPDNIWVYNNVNNVWIKATLATTLQPGWAMWILMVAPATLYPQ